MSISSNDPGRAPMIMGIMWTLTMIATLVVTARLYLRKQLGSLSWDDMLMLLALILQLVDLGFLMKAISYGLGKHDADLTYFQLTHALKWGWLYMIPGTFVAVFARISSALLLCRLFGIRVWFKWYLIILTILQCIGGALVLLVNFVGVRPVQALWDPTIPAAKINSDVGLYTAFMVQAIFTIADLTFVFFPVIFIWKLQMTRSRKIGLILLMCTSLVTATASIIKARWAQATSAALTDPLYQSSLAALLAGIEQTLVIILGSVPTLRALSTVNIPLFSRVNSSLASLFGHTRKSSKSAESYASAGHYHDIEQNTHKLGNLGLGAQGVEGSAATTTTYATQGSRGYGAAGDQAAGVLRTDHFSISYNNKH